MYRPAETEDGAYYEVAPADIYCLATTILVLMIQDLPFGKMSRDTLDYIYERAGSQDRFFNKLYSSFSNGEERHPREIQDLLYRCLNPNPELRPSIYDF